MYWSKLLQTRSLKSGHWFLSPVASGETLSLSSSFWCWWVFLLDALLQSLYLLSNAFLLALCLHTIFPLRGSTSLSKFTLSGHQSYCVRTQPNDLTLTDCISNNSISKWGHISRHQRRTSTYLLGGTIQPVRSTLLKNLSVFPMTSGFT